MKTLNLTEQQAKEVLKNTTDEGLKQIITSNFPNLENKGLGRWEDLGEIEGYYISTVSNIISAERLKTEDKENKNTYVTEKQALQALAYAQLSQLAKASGMECTSNDGKKYFIYNYKGKFIIDWCMFTLSGINLHFKTEEFANKFLKAHKELWKQFYGI